jgi:hypothetical protein
VNRIGLGCYKGCTATDNTVIKVDLTSPNYNSWWWENSLQLWHNMSTEDYAIKVIFNRTIYKENGYVRSVPIVLNESYYWDEFRSSYDLKDGSIDFKILNSVNSTLCSGLGSILSCAGSTSPIKLYADLTRPTGNSPEIDEWLVSWLPPTIEEIRGASEMHISPAFNMTCNLDQNATLSAIISTNETQNTNYQNLNTNINSQFINTNLLINTLNTTITWWGNQNDVVTNYWGGVLQTLINYWGNYLDAKINSIIVGNVTVTANVDYDEIALTVMQYLKALQKQQLI